MTSLLEYVEAVFKASPDISDKIPEDLLVDPEFVSLCEVCSTNLQLVQYFPDLSLEEYSTTILPSLKNYLLSPVIMRGKVKEEAIDGRLEKLDAVSTLNLELV